jgi:hypothetical protein
LKCTNEIILLVGEQSKMIKIYFEIVIAHTASEKTPRQARDLHYFYHMESQGVNASGSIHPMPHPSARSVTFIRFSPHNSHTPLMHTVSRIT